MLEEILSISISGRQFQQLDSRLNKRGMMKIEVSNKDFVTYLILILLVAVIVVMWMKMDNIRLENQVNMNTQNIRNIDVYLQQQIQLQKQNEAPTFELTPKKDKE